MGLLISVWLRCRLSPGRGPEEAGAAVRGRDGRGVRQAGASVDSSAADDPSVSQSINRFSKLL